MAFHRILPVMGACLVLASCVTTDSDTISGWSFVEGFPIGNKSYGFSVVEKSKGHPVRSGDKALRFEVRSGDCGVGKSGWNDCKKQRERRELRQEDNINSGENWYHWSIYLPKDFPIIWQAETALGQFHNMNHRTPPFMFRIVGRADLKQKKYVETYSVRNLLGGSPGNDRLISIDEMRGKWTDILVHIKWAIGKNGFFRVYVNGETKPRYDWSGSTKRRGYLDVYFRFGIYNHFISSEVPSRIVYYDDVRRGRTCSAVTEYFDCSKLMVN